MRCLSLLLFALLTALPCASTPVTFDGSYLTPADEFHSLPWSENHSLVTDWDGNALLALEAWVTPQGGTYVTEANRNYFSMWAGITLMVYDALGTLMKEVVLSGGEGGFTPSPVSLGSLVTLDFIPAFFELFVDGRDARVDWSVQFFTAGDVVSGDQAVPEPMTLGLLAAGLCLIVLQGRLHGRAHAPLPSLCPIRRDSLRV